MKTGLPAIPGLSALFVSGLPLRGPERWSSKILRLQLQVVGHWMRQREGDVRGLAARMQLWRCLQWWNRGRAVVSRARHPQPFRAANLERSLFLSVQVKVGIMPVTLERDGSDFGESGLTIWMFHGHWGINFVFACKSRCSACLLKLSG